MQVEVKLVLNSEADFRFVCDSLSKSLARKETHDNHFLDTADASLRGSGAHLRLRFVNDTQCSLTLKEHATYEGGTATRWSKEETIDVSTGRLILGNPLSLLARTGSVVVDTLRQHFAPTALRHIGGFTTTRSVFTWDDCNAQPGLVMRLDHTVFPFGHRFEIEVPDITVPAQDVLDEIAVALDRLGVTFAVAQESKLEAFLNGTRAALAKSHMVQDAKLILNDRQSFDILRGCLAPSFMTKEDQINYFFDSPCGELQSKGAHLRVRAVGDTYVAVIKEHHGISDGSSIYWGRQVDLSADVFESMLRSPTTFLHTNTSVAHTLLGKFGINTLQCVGSFRNSRSVFDWSTARSQSGLTIQLDHTIFPFGERFEVEVPNVSVPLTDVIDELSATLAACGITSEVGTDSKFNVFFEGQRH